MFETEAVEIKAEMPKKLRNKSAQEIILHLQDNFRTDFELDEDGRIKAQIPLNKETAYMMAVSKALFDPTNWKAPFKAWFPKCGEEWAKAAAIWYHGAKPHSNGYWVYSPGYQC